MGVGVYSLDKFAWDEEKEEFRKDTPYFGRSWWTWRPLWNFVYAQCRDIITKEEHEKGHFNCGDLFKPEICRAIADRIRYLEAPKETWAESGPRPHDNPYGFNTQDIRDFAEFLTKANGMSIH